MGAWAFDHQRDALARAGMKVAFSRGCWRLYREGHEIARRTTASAMRAYLAERFKCSGPGKTAICPFSQDAIGGPWRGAGPTR